MFEGNVAKIIEPEIFFGTLELTEILFKHAFIGITPNMMLSEPN
tara:strand:+ start:419 stop:550 length:132 start_codon:yes stop_codon:yes gene_type:complete